MVAANYVPGVPACKPAAKGFVVEPLQYTKYHRPRDFSQHASCCSAVQRGGHSQSYQPVRNGHVHRPGRTNLLVMNRTSLWSAAVMHIHLSRAFQGRRQACICQSCHAFADEASSPLTESELCQMWPKCQRSKKSLIPLHSYTRVLALLHCKE